MTVPLEKVNEKHLATFSDADLTLLLQHKKISQEAYDKEMNFRKEQRQQKPKFRMNKDKIKVEDNQLKVPQPKEYKPRLNMEHPDLFVNDFLSKEDKMWRMSMTDLQLLLSAGVISGEDYQWSIKKKEDNPNVKEYSNYFNEDDIPFLKKAAKSIREEENGQSEKPPNPQKNSEPQNVGKEKTAKQPSKSQKPFQFDFSNEKKFYHQLIKIDESNKLERLNIDDLRLLKKAHLISRKDFKEIKKYQKEHPEIKPYRRFIPDDKIEFLNKVYHYYDDHSEPKENSEPQNVGKEKTAKQPSKSESKSDPRYRSKSPPPTHIPVDKPAQQRVYSQETPAPDSASLMARAIQNFKEKTVQNESRSLFDPHYRSKSPPPPNSPYALPNVQQRVYSQETPAPDSASLMTRAIQNFKEKTVRQPTIKLLPPDRIPGKLELEREFYFDDPKKFAWQITQMGDYIKGLRSEDLNVLIKAGFVSPELYDKIIEFKKNNPGVVTKDRHITDDKLPFVQQAMIAALQNMDLMTGVREWTNEDFQKKSEPQNVGKEITAQQPSKSETVIQKTVNPLTKSGEPKPFNFSSESKFINQMKNLNGHLNRFNTDDLKLLWRARLISGKDYNDIRKYQQAHPDEKPFNRMIPEEQLPFLHKVYQNVGKQITVGSPSKSQTVSENPDPQNVVKEITEKPLSKSEKAKKRSEKMKKQMESIMQRKILFDSRYRSRSPPPPNSPYTLPNVQPVVHSLETPAPDSASLMARAVQRRNEVTAVQATMLPPNAEGTPSTNAVQAATTYTNPVVPDPDQHDAVARERTYSNVNEYNPSERSASVPVTAAPTTVPTRHTTPIPQRPPMTTTPSPITPITPAASTPTTTPTVSDEGAKSEIKYNAEGNRIQKIKYGVTANGERYIKEIVKYNGRKGKENKEVGRQSFKPPKAPELTTTQKIKKSWDTGTKHFWDTSYDPANNQALGLSVANALSAVSGGLQGSETYGYVASGVGNALAASGHPIGIAAGAIVSAGGALYQIYRSREKDREAARARKAQILNDARAANWENFNASQAVANLRNALSLVHKKDRMRNLNKAFIGKSLRATMDTMKETNRMALHNARLEQVEHQRYIDEHAYENYKWGLERQYKAAQEKLKEEEAKKVETQQQPLKAVAESVKGTALEGPMNHLLNWYENQAPYNDAQNNYNNFVDYKPLAEHLYSQSLARYNNQFTNDQINQSDRRFMDKVGSSQEYNDAMSKEGPTMWTHKEELENFLAQERQKRAKFDNIFGTAKAIGGHILNAALEFLPQGVTAVIRKAEEELAKHPDLKDSYVTMIKNEVAREAENRAAKRKEIEEEMKTKKAKTEEVIQETAKILPYVGASEDDSLWDQGVDLVKKGFHFITFHKFENENDKFRRKAVNALMQQGASANWNKIIELNKQTGNIEELVPKNEDQQKTLDALASMGEMKEKYKNEEDIAQAAEAKMMIDEEYNVPNFDYNGLNDGDWVKNFGKAFIENSAEHRNILKAKGISNPRDMKMRRKAIQQNFLIQDNPDFSTYKDFEKAKMLLSQEDFDNEVVRPINEFKIKRGIDLSKDLVGVFNQALQANKERRELAKKSTEQEITYATNLIAKMEAGSIARLRHAVLPKNNKDLKKAFAKGFRFITDTNELNPEYVKADTARNYFIRSMHELWGQIGHGTSEQDRGFFQSPEGQKALTFNGKSIFDIANFTDPNNIKKLYDQLALVGNGIQGYYLRNGIVPSQRYFEGREHHADDRFNLQRSAAVKRSFLDEDIQKKFSKTKDNLSPAELLSRTNQEAAVITAIEDPYTGLAAADVFDGIKNLDNIPSTVLSGLGRKANKKGFYSQQDRRAFGASLERKYTQRLERQREKYKEKTQNLQDPFKTKIIFGTPFLVERNEKTGHQNWKDMKAMDDELVDVHLRSAIPYDDSNKTMKKIRDNIDITEFGEPGEAPRKAKNLKNTHIFTVKDRNGKKFYRVISPKFREPLDLGYTDAEPPRLQSDAQLLGQKVAKSKPAVPANDSSIAAVLDNQEKQFAKIANDALSAEQKNIESRKSNGGSGTNIDLAAAARRAENERIIDNLNKKPEAVEELQPDLIGPKVLSYVANNNSGPSSVLFAHYLDSHPLT